MDNNNCKITEDDVVEIFCKSNTKKIQESGLTELAIYKNNQKLKFEKPKELVSYMLADLIVYGYVKQKISLYYFLSNAQNLSVSMFIVGLVAKVKTRVMKNL